MCITRAGIFTPKLAITPPIRVPRRGPRLISSPMKFEAFWKMKTPSAVNTTATTTSEMARVAPSPSLGSRRCTRRASSSTSTIRNNASIRGVRIGLSQSRAAPVPITISTTSALRIV